MFVVQVPGKRPGFPFFRIRKQTRLAALQVATDLHVQGLPVTILDDEGKVYHPEEFEAFGRGSYEPECNIKNTHR